MLNKCNRLMKFFIGLIFLFRHKGGEAIDDSVGNHHDPKLEVGKKIAISVYREGLMQNIDEEPEKREEVIDLMKKCPFCRKEFGKAQTMCMHCGSNLLEQTKSSDKKANHIIEDTEEIMALFGCTWSLPANYGACICCRGKIVLKRFWWSSGLQGLFFNSITLPLLFTKKLKSLRQKKSYRMIEESGDIVMDIGQIQNITILKGRRWTTVIVTKKNGHKVEFMMRYGAFQFSQIYTQLSFEVA